jgi:hypothetical protein
MRARVCGSTPPEGVYAAPRHDRDVTRRSRSGRGVSNRRRFGVNQ